MGEYLLSLMDLQVITIFYYQVSAVASAFVDNIPLTTMMIKIAISLAQNKALGLPLQPLVWALAFGACLGGNFSFLLYIMNSEVKTS